MWFRGGQLCVCVGTGDFIHALKTLVWWLQEGVFRNRTEGSDSRCWDLQNFVTKMG